MELTKAVDMAGRIKTLRELNLISPGDRYDVATLQKAIEDLRECTSSVRHASPPVYRRYQLREMPSESHERQRSVH